MTHGAGKHGREVVPGGGSTAVDRRIADLEAHVARLEARLAAVAGPAARSVSPNGDAQAVRSGIENAEKGRYDRRALLRRGGYVVAGAAGVAALPALAACGDGSNFLLGSNNQTQSPTTLNRSTSSAIPTLILGSTLPTATNPQLRLSPLRSAPPPATQAGDLFVQAGSSGIPALLYFTHQPQQGSVGAAIGTVYTDFLANLFVPVSQDTSTGYAGPRAFNARVAAGTTATIDLSRFLAPAGLAVAVVGTLSVSEPSGAGSATVFTPPSAPSVPTPHVSWPVAGAASSLVVAVPGDSGSEVNRLLVAIKPNAVSAMVTFDVAGFFVPSPANLLAEALAPSVAGASEGSRTLAPRSFGQVLGR